MTDWPARENKAKKYADSYTFDWPLEKTSREVGENSEFRRCLAHGNEHGEAIRLPADVGQVFTPAKQQSSPGT